MATPSSGLHPLTDVQLARALNIEVRASALLHDRMPASRESRLSLCLEANEILSDWAFAALHVPGLTKVPAWTSAACMGDTDELVYPPARLAQTSATLMERVLVDFVDAWENVFMNDAGNLSVTRVQQELVNRHGMADDFGNASATMGTILDAMHADPAVRALVMGNLDKAIAALARVRAQSQRILDRAVADANLNTQDRQAQMALVAELGEGGTGLAANTVLQQTAAERAVLVAERAEERAGPRV